MKAEKFEQQFDEGVDVMASLDLSKAKRVLQEQKRVPSNAELHVERIQAAAAHQNDGLRRVNQSICCAIAVT